MEVDPDYAFDISQDSLVEADRKRQAEDDAREVAIEKIRNIITNQFSEEIASKEREVTLITERLTEVRHVLDRLRACVVASYYASSFAKSLEKNKLEPGVAQHPVIQNVLRKAATSVLSKNAPPKSVVPPENDAEVQHTSVSSTASDAIDRPPNHKDLEGISKIAETDTLEEDASEAEPSFTQDKLGGRHRIKKRIIVGNVSKYIPPDKREGIDKSTHKWMVYVRGSADEPRIDHFVRKVWFFLHPSYRPNDLVEVTETPFHLTRRGWGEFPIRVQLHFCDPRNRRVDIIHQLRLDRTYTGLQTIGAETVCEVELDQSTFGLHVENLLNDQPLMSCGREEQTSGERTGSQSSSPSSSMSLSVLPRHSGVVSQTHKNTKMDISCEENAGARTVPAEREDDNSQPVKKQVTEQNKTDPDIQSHQNEAVEDLINDILKSVEEKLNETDKVEETTTECDVMEEENFSLGPGVSTEKKRRRRRGDSCSVVEKDGALKEKSLALRLLCSDNDLEEDCAEEIDVSTVPQENDENGKISFSKPKGTIETELSREVIEKSSDRATPSGGKISSASLKHTVLSPVEPCTDAAECSSSKLVTLSPVKNCDHVKPLSPPKDKSSNDKQAVSPRLRSFSADTAEPPVVGRKVVYLKKATPGSSALSINQNKLTGQASSAVVVLRPRSSSSEISSQRFTQTSKGNVTIITPISKTKNQRFHVVSRKRTLDNSSSEPKEALVYNVVPEKQRKISFSPPENENQLGTSGLNPLKLISISEQAKQIACSTDSVPSSTTSSTGKMTLTVPGSKVQSPTAQSSTKEVYLHLSSSGATVVPSTKLKPTKTETQTPAAVTKAQTPKSYVLKNTKQGLIVVNQTPPIKDHTPAASKPSACSSSSTMTSQVSSEAQPQSVSLPDSKDASISGTKQGKQLSQQQMLSFQALQTALMGAGVQLNKPMQIKIEKSSGKNETSRLLTSRSSGGQTSMDDRSQQQFVLTTVTNKQGKQQLALVSADRLKQAAKNKSFGTGSSNREKGSPVESPSQMSVKYENITNALNHDRGNNQENTPFYKVVGNKILSRKIKDIDKEALPLATRFIPLVREGRNITDLPFCAESEADFLDWNVGKQRASELQRACMIHKVLSYVRDHQTNMNEATIPSKRYIMEWCLLRGYSVFTDEYEVNDEEKSPEEESDPTGFKSTITCGDELVRMLEKTPATRPLPRCEDEEEIDIISVTPPQHQSVQVKTEQVDMDVTENKRIRITPTAEMRAVDASTSQIGLKFDDVPISDSINAPLCQAILAKLLQLFTKDLATEALASAILRRDGDGPVQRVLPERVEVEDVVRAVLHHSSFDMLRDSNLGKETPFIL